LDVPACNCLPRPQIRTRTAWSLSSASRLDTRNSQTALRSPDPFAWKEQSHSFLAIGPLTKQCRRPRSGRERRACGVRAGRERDARLPQAALRRRKRYPEPEVLVNRENAAIAGLMNPGFESPTKRKTTSAFRKSGSGSRSAPIMASRCGCLSAVPSTEIARVLERPQTVPSLRSVARAVYPRLPAKIRCRLRFRAVRQPTLMKRSRFLRALRGRGARCRLTLRTPRGH
jgi:hypothetical protein